MRNVGCEDVDQIDAIRILQERIAQRRIREVIARALRCIVAAVDPLHESSDEQHLGDCSGIRLMQDGALD
ncbi:MAG: hypothetical protein ACLGH0_07860, partial [Thermoanaerobaculia bacterium]